MSKYHDDSTHAEAPGGVSLSLEKLRALEPELFTSRTFKCWSLCDVDHPAAEMRERIAEHLEIGDSRAAIVVSIAPLVVAAYSDDLDTVALLRFPLTFVARYNLVVGSRLLTVNSYRQVTAEDQTLYAADIVPGPLRLRWSTFFPIIADFLSDDTDRIESRKQSISAEEWERTHALSAIRIERFGLATARSGKPTLVGEPIQVEGRPSYVPIDYIPGQQVSMPRSPQRLVVWAVVAIVALVLAFLRFTGRL